MSLPDPGPGGIGSALSAAFSSGLRGGRTVARRRARQRFHPHKRSVSPAYRAHLCYWWSSGVAYPLAASSPSSSLLRPKGLGPLSSGVGFSHPPKGRVYRLSFPPGPFTFADSPGPLVNGAPGLPRGLRPFLGFVIEPLRTLYRYLALRYTPLGNHLLP